MTIGLPCCRMWRLAIHSIVLGAVMPDNQTREEWLEVQGVLDDPGVLGTGVALRHPNDEQRQFVRRITYDEMLRLDEREKFFAFLWVPEAVSSFEKVSKSACGGRCSRTCKKPGCICNRSIGKCV